MRTINTTLLAATILAMSTLAGCGNESEKAATQAAENGNSVYGPAPAEINYGVAKVYPHDTNAFTEGFLVHKGQLFESTGSPSDLPQTRSLVGIVDMNTGNIDTKVELDRDKYFGEGIVILNDKLYQLTYLAKTGFVYDLNTFEKLEEFTFPSKEGWGMTTDSTHLIMSDGTSRLTYLHPETFEKVREVGVYDNNGPVKNLNELEYINGYIYANVYTTNTIVKIDPKSGQIVGKLYLTALAQDAANKNPNALELNGIAWDAEKDKIYVTGKMWPNIYEIQFKH
ncbi:glutaminyl-peptide cyclotransferase [Pontibacter akesuensis]|uniref:Glutamine cyclotransferase n=1 Tax=Pontibacter akesuensis TaxID=388950 RepID=A0A1I7FPW8_9BACT|nr:glutaminyl-peptide cyclotransferase [Pontibacter akesuensis]GHA61066.1 glutamine cyclotransferase [Pontibacter akesuensis]SFU38230.1 Glutamine cyclotransferase [Pontibacter akesuensis]